MGESADATSYLQYFYSLKVFANIFQSQDCVLASPLAAVWQLGNLAVATFSGGN